MSLRSWWRRRQQREQLEQARADAARLADENVNDDHEAWFWSYFEGDVKTITDAREREQHGQHQVQDPA